MIFTSVNQAVLNQALLNQVALNQMVQKDPNAVTQFIANILGVIMNFIYNLIDSIADVNVLGVAIIAFTVISRLIMLPLTFSQQKSTKRMQALNPEVEKIKKKYEGMTDKESQNTMNQEVQTLYAREKINPFAGCLPLLIQLPIFYALYNVMQYPYRYIDSIKTLYVDKLAGTLMNVFRADRAAFDSFIPFARAHFSAKDNFSFDTAEQLAKLLNKLSETEWVQYITTIPQKFGAEITNLNTYLVEKKAVETFLGLNLVESAGLTFPKILIPIISGVTSFLSQYLMTKQTSPAGDGKDAMAATQKNMLIFMPLFMAFITINTPIGVGLYWIAGNIVLLIQQPIIEFLFSKKGNQDK